MTRGRWVAALALLVVAGVVAVALWAFEPWRAFTSSEVDEALPSVPAASAAAEPAAGTDPTPTRGPKPSPTPSPSPAATPPPTPEVVDLATGDFETAEHATTGTARVIELADGRRFVRLEGLATSDGPDLHVWVTDQPSGGSWGSYDDGRYVRLGELKATHGNHNYEVPADADLGGLRSVVIWCDRFDVAFGTAPVAL